MCLGAYVSRQSRGVLWDGKAVLTNALPVEHCRIIIYDTKLYTQTQECDDPSSPLGELFL